MFDQAPIRRPSRAWRNLLALASLCLIAGVSSPASAAGDPSASGEQQAEPTRSYIVVLEGSVNHPGRVAQRHAVNRDAELSHVYKTAIEGYAAEMTPANKEAIETDPNVAFVERDMPIEALGQTVPSGVRRAFALDNPTLDIDEKDDVQVNADVVVMDSGIDFDHPDLRVVARANCLGARTHGCASDAGDDICGHGTHVAGTVGAIDNGFGVVGVAPGVRLWGVKVLDNGCGGHVGDWVAAVDWVTARAGQIEVVNMSIGCKPAVHGDCANNTTALQSAIYSSIGAGIVYVAAAGNDTMDVSGVLGTSVRQLPADFEDVITVSNLSDYDGLPGGLAPTPPANHLGCNPQTELNIDADDTLSASSNWGPRIDIAAPGSCILSTYKHGGYRLMSGTSMASPHVAGAAAILASKSNPSNAGDVLAIRGTLRAQGNSNWTDDGRQFDISGKVSAGPDGIKEPLLDVGNEAAFTVSNPGSVGSVGVVSHTPGSIDLFARNGNNEIWHKVYHSGTQWGEWYTEPLPSGKPIYGAPAVGSRNSLSRDLFVRDQDGYLYFRNFYSGQGWSPWFWIPGPHEGKILDSPAVTDRPDRQNGLDVVVRADNNRIYFKEYTDPTGWGQWYGMGEPPPGTASSPATAFHDLHGSWHLMVRGKDGAIWDRFWVEGQGWIDWATLGSPPGGAISAPALTATGSGNDLYLFAVGADGAMWMRKGTNGWGPWESLGGQWVSDPAATSKESHGVSVFASGLDNKIQERRFLYGGWTNWMRIDDDCPPGGCTWNPGGPGTGKAHSVETNDLVTVDASGTANVFGGWEEGIDPSEPVKSLEGQLDPALLDGKGHYVVDVSDVNDDSYSDLITVKDDGKVLVHLGKEDRTFAAALDSGISLPPLMNGAGQNEPIAVADVTGDGFDDLVAFNGSGSGSFDLYKGQSNGKFATSAVKSTENVGTSALLDAVGQYFIDLADVTGDGLADLVTSNTNGIAYVYKGNADGKLGPWSIAASINPVMNDGAGQEPVGVGDVTGDGKADLLTLDGSTLKLWSGKEDATFATATNPYAGSVDSSLMDGAGDTLLGLLDYDGSGRTDLVSVTAAGNLRTYTTKVDGTFSAPVTNTGASVTAIRHRWFGHEVPMERPLLRRAGCAASACELPMPRSASSDADGDGHGDLVTLSPDGVIYTYRGNTEHKLASGSPVESFRINGVGAINTALFDGVGNYLVDVADVTGDRTDDLIALSSGGVAVTASGTSSAAFSHSIVGSLSGLTPGLGAPGGYEPIAGADVNRDGRADLIVYNDATDQVMVYPGNANGAFSAGIVAQGSVTSALHTGSGEYLIDAGDVTGDGRADLVSMATASDSLSVRPGKSDGTFGTVVASHAGQADTSLDDGTGLEPWGLGDVTGDRKADLVLHSSSTGTIAVYPGQADGKFGTAVNSFAVPSSTFGATGHEVAGVIDVNGDGYGDLVAASPSGLVHVVPGQATGVFSTSMVASFGAFKSTQHGKNQDPSGRELLFEKPIVRRQGCSAGGC